MGSWGNVLKTDHQLRYTHDRWGGLLIPTRLNLLGKPIDNLDTLQCPLGPFGSWARTARSGWILLSEIRQGFREILDNVQRWLRHGGWWYTAKERNVW